MRSIKPLSRKSAAAISFAVFSCLGSRQGWAQTQISTWNGIADQTWENPLNWTPSGVPNNNTNGFTDYNVSIGAPSPTVLNSAVTIDSLTVGAAGILDMSGNSALTLNGPTLSLQGTLTVNSDQAFAVTSLTLNNVTVTANGNGTINLNDDDTNTTATIDGTFTFAIGNTISGEGAINAALTNYGIVDSTLPGHNIYLQTSDKINNGFFTADNGGTLNIASINISQGTAGLIASDDSSTVLMTGASITGGSLGGTGMFFVEGGGNSFTDLSSDATVAETGSQTLVINGNFANSFTLTVNSDQAFAPTSVDFTGGTMTGNGFIILNDDATNTTATVDGTLVLDNGSIIGEGSINAELTNYGRVDANVSGHTIYMQTGDKINYNLFEATKGGTLDFESINVAQFTDGQIAAIGAAGTASQINLNATAVIGGLISISGGSVLQMSGSTFTGGILTLAAASTLTTTGGINTVSGITSNGIINVHGNSMLDIVGDLSNTGTITVNDDQSFTPTAISFDGGTLSGGGTLTLNDDATNTTATVDGTLIQAATNTINGQGAINALLTNNGTVNANLNGHSIILQTSDKTNNNLFEATNGGTLVAANININQGTAGQITAGSGAFVVLSTVAVTGGALNGAGLITFQASGNSLTNVTNSAMLNVAGGQSLVINGSLSNSGIITVNSDQAFAPTGITFSGTVFGAGTIALNDDATTTTATVDGSLTQSIGHTISGQGAINAALTNNGTVNANLAGHAIYLQTNNKINNSLFEATSGGTLAITGININQGIGGQITATGSGSRVSISNSNITGGIISIATGGTLQFSGVMNSINSPIKGNGTVTVDDNTFARLRPSSVPNTVAAVKLGSGSTLDITTNRLLINFGSPANDPVSTIATALKSGYNGGTWTGTGIDSSTAAGNPTVLSVGYADGNTDTGTAAGPNQIVVKYALAGDATLTGTVNFNDLVAVVQNFNKSGTDWAHGNFFYGATTNFNDLVAVVQNFNKSPNPAATSGDKLGGTTIPLIQSTDVQLPEPAALMLAALPLGSLLARRRANQRAR